jgi:hypothetical protein
LKKKKKKKSFSKKAANIFEKNPDRGLDASIISTP